MINLELELLTSIEQEEKLNYINLLGLYSQHSIFFVTYEFVH
jgi:hypothetical protein